MSLLIQQHTDEDILCDTSCPVPDDHPRVKERIEHPNKPFSPEHSLEVLTHCIQQGVIQAERAKGKDLLLFLGNTGAGKSTFANYLSGCTMIGVDPETFGKVADSDLVMVKPPEKGGTRKQLMTIGHSTTSQTFLPHIATPGRSSGLDLTFCDCPGFLDSRGLEINIANAVNIRATVAAAKSIRLLILLNYSSISNDRGAGVKHLLKLCADIFGSVDELVKRRDSLLIGVIRCQKYDTMDVSKMRRFITEGAEGKAAEQLAERLLTAVHHAVEQQLVDVEKKRAETQLRLDEQQAATEALVEQLQRQVHTTQVEKDAAIEQRAELEKQIAQTREVLDKAKADQEELLRLQTAEAQRNAAEKAKAVAVLSLISGLRFSPKQCRLLKREDQDLRHLLNLRPARK